MRRYTYLHHTPIRRYQDARAISDAASRLLQAATGARYRRNCGRRRNA